MTRADDLRTPYRSVRPISAPVDGPWPGMLTWLVSGERSVMVDAALLGDDWRGWDAAADGHVITPLDIVRRADGHDVALPVCTERVADFLARRRARGAPVTAGEAVTVGISLLRGCVEMLDRHGAAGEWWLTEAGRPVLAADASDRDVVEGAVELLTELSAGAPDSRAWAEAIAAITAARPSRDEIERAEHGLFRITDPLPLATSAAHPRTARDLAPYDRAEAVHTEGSGRTGLWHALAGHVDADLADLVSRTTTSLWRRVRTRQGSRRRPWIVGGAAAAALLSVGLLWPSGEAGPSTDGTAERTAGAPDPTPDIAPSAGGVTAGAADPQPIASADEHDPVVDPGKTAGELLDRRRDCEGDAACLQEVMVDPAVPVSAGPVDLARDQRAIVLLDDFGGVAVLRVDALDGNQEPQVVVIARIDDEWLLREVHDTAQQP